MDYIGLGRRVKQKRKLRGTKQDVLARKVGISLSFLGHIERGSRKASIETLIKLAIALDTGTDELLQDSMPLRILAKSIAFEEQVQETRQTRRSALQTVDSSAMRDSPGQDELEEQDHFMQSFFELFGLPPA